MSLAGARQGIPKDPFEPLLQQIGSLAEVDAIAVITASRTATHQPLTGSSWGILAQIGPKELFVLFDAQGRVPRHLPTATVVRLGGTPASRGLAAPVLEPMTGQLSGGVVVLYQPRRVAHARAEGLLDYLVHQATLELERTRIISGLEQELALARHLSADHVGRRESDRSQLAETIHDDLSQSVTYIRLALGSLQRRLDAGLVEKARGELVGLATASEEMKDTIEKLLASLGPAMIEVLGPIPAITNEARQHTAATGRPVQCNLENLDLPGPVSLAMLRIVQEGLSNIARHARAQHVSIRITADQSQWRLSIEDDGCSFDAAACLQSLSFLKMQERAKLVGGALLIQSRPGQGTRVEASFPIQSGRRPTPD